MNPARSRLQAYLIMIVLALGLTRPWNLSAQNASLYIVISPENANRLSLLTEMRSDNNPYIDSLLWSKDGKTITLSYEGQGVHVNVENMTLLPQDTLPVAYNHEGKPLALSFEKTAMTLSEMLTGDPVFQLPSTGKEWAHFSLNAETTDLAMSSIENEIDVWDLVSGDHLWTLTRHEIPPYALAFNTSGTLLASGGYDNLALLWDMSTGELQCDLSWADTHIEALAFNPEGSRLAIGGSRGTVLQLLDVDAILKSQCVEDSEYTSSNPPPYVILRETSVVGASTAVAFSPDGALLVEGGTYGTFPSKDPDTFIHLRTGDSGELIATHVVSDLPQWMAFSPDNQFLAVAGRDYLQLWGVPQSLSDHR